MTNFKNLFNEISKLHLLQNIFSHDIDIINFPGDYYTNNGLFIIQ